MALPRYNHSAAGVLHIRTIEAGTEGSWTAVGNNASLITTGTISDARLPSSISSDITGNSATATKLATARTIAGVSFDGSANISLNNNAITNGAGYITGLSFANLSGKTSGTGDYSTDGDIVAGRGSGSIALTINDGKGNSNLTFNHQNGVPDQNGNAARIEVNTDSTSGAAIMFEVKSNVTGGTGVTLTSVLDLLETEIRPHKDIIPVSDSSKNIGSSSVRFANGYFDTLYGSGANLTNLPSQTDNNFTNADHSKLDGIESGATADQTASEILTLIKTVDGAGSGLDADKVDGLSSASFARADTDDTLAGIYTLTNTNRDCFNFSGNATDDNRGLAFNGRIAISADYNDGWLRLNNAGEFGNGVYTPGKVRSDTGFHIGGTTVINSSGNYIQALSSASDYSTLLRSNAADTATGDITFSGGAGAVTIAANSDIRLTAGTWTGDAYGKIQHHSGRLYLGGGTDGIIFRENSTNRWKIDGSGHFVPASTNTYNIGSSSLRVANLYVNDMHFSNEGKTNDVDGSWGDWTLQEGESDIFMINNRSGKKFKIAMIPV